MLNGWMLDIIIAYIIASNIWRLLEYSGESWKMFERLETLGLLDIEIKTI